MENDELTPRAMEASDLWCTIGIGEWIAHEDGRVELRPFFPEQTLTLTTKNYGAGPFRNELHHLIDEVLEKWVRAEPFADWAKRSTEAWVRRSVEAIIGDVCDGTWGGLSGARFIEYKTRPQEVADRLVRLIMDDILASRETTSEA